DEAEGAARHEEGDASDSKCRKTDTNTVTRVESFDRLMKKELIARLNKFGPMEETDDQLNKKGLAEKTATDV
ncbi:unnamed protein product, partial [Symbiodinium microadriaticum]